MVVHDAPARIRPHVGQLKSRQIWDLSAPTFSKWDRNRRAPAQFELVRRISRSWRGGALGALLVFGAAAAITTSCVDLESLGNGPPDVITGSADGGEEAALGDDPCAHHGLVPPPASDDDANPDASLPTFELAIDKVVLDPAIAPGFDLDGVCSCDARPKTRGDGGGSCAPTKGGSVFCDLDGGVDNAVGVVAREASPVFAIDTIPNRLLAAGMRGLLLQIAKYNGRANDKEVIVGAMMAEGIRSQGCPASVRDDAGFYSPGRCGDDGWTLSPTTVVTTGGGVHVPLVVGTGWVNDYRLVVQFVETSKMTLPFSASRSISFAAPALMARIVPLDENLAPREPPSRAAQTDREKRLYRLDDGVFTGRVEPTELLGTIGSYNSSTGPLCKNPAFDVIRTRICASRDLSGATNIKTPNPAAACDALSAAFGFVALPAKTDGVTALSLPSDPCANEPPDSGAFTCEP